MKHKPQGPAEHLALGRDVYNYRCYFCHGYAGDAKTLAASFLEPPPLAFVEADPDVMTRQRMIDAVTDGRKGSAMMAFARQLSGVEIEAVVDFVRQNFMNARRSNTRYHTPENGWQDHQRYRDAFPFALGEIALDTPWESLSERQRIGKRLYLSSCVSCHDRGKVEDEGRVWEARPLSFPRNQYSHKDGTAADSLSGASVYAVHEQAPQLSQLTDRERRGESLYQHNCAFCHAPDGTGKHWIGQYLQPHPRNFTESAKMNRMTDQALRHAIRQGVNGTAMPAWKSVLSEDQIDDIIAYIKRAFITPANE